MNEYKDLLLKALSMKLNYYEEEATNDDNNKILFMNIRNPFFVLYFNKNI